MRVNYFCKKNAPYIALCVLFIINLFITWPGSMTADSLGQYKAAIEGVFSDHHPPIMSIIWRILDHIHRGQGLLLFINLFMLYTASALFIAIFYNSKIRWLYVLFPIWPQISFYSHMIWKDIAFSFSFLLVSAILSFCMMFHKKPGFFLFLVIISLIFYGTAVKFQAQYVAPFLTLGLAYCFTLFKVTTKTIFFAIFSYTVLWLCVHGFNNYFVPQEKKSHSWQYVKLYDLAAISLQQKQALFPDFVINNPNFSLEAVAQKFDHTQVDALVFSTHCPLKAGKTPHDRALLWHYWYNQVKKHPSAYLYHRYLNWKNMITGMPLQQLDTMDFAQFGGMGWLNKLQKADTITEPILYYLGKILFWLLSYARYLFQFTFLLPLLLFYFLLSIFSLRKNRAGMPLFMMSGIGVAFLVVMFFFSMASMLRYLYIVVCMVHASHGFAYTCLKNFCKK